MNDSPVDEPYHKLFEIVEMCMQQQNSEMWLWKSVKMVKDCQHKPVEQSAFFLFPKSVTFITKIYLKK